MKGYGSKEVILRNSLDDLQIKSRAIYSEKNSLIRKKETFQKLLNEIMREVATVWKNKDDISKAKVFNHF